VLLDDVIIGKKCRIGPGVILAHVRIGDNVVIHAGTCIGQDGFGFTIGKESNESHKKKPQNMEVEIEDDVEIGYVFELPLSDLH